MEEKAYAKTEAQKEKDASKIQVDADVIAGMVALHKLCPVQDCGQT